MKRTHRGSPRLEPQQIYNYFCELMRRQPGELNIDTKSGFNGLVGQFFIVPKRQDFFVKLRPTMRAWHEEIEKQMKEQSDAKRKRTYVKRRRRSITDNLWTLLGQLYWNYGAWIILRGECKAMKKALSDHQIEKRLKENYGYLSQVKRDGWFEEVKSGGSPSDLAIRDTAESLGRSEESLRLMLSPGRLRESPPASLIRATMDSKKLLSRLRRIPPFRRTAKDQALIRAIESEFYPPADYCP